ncbi:MAG: siphovirus ReqiPepy6 Gp37-like family protein [Christensenellales bacterium]|jgi:hypothetical protein
MKPVRILSSTLDLLGEVDNYLSLTFCRSYHSPGEFQLVTNRKVQNAEQLDINNLIMLGADPLKTGIVRHKEIRADERGVEMLTIKGYELGAIFHQRITVPPVGQAYDIQEGNAETVMKHYVQRNCLDIPGMEFPFLVIGDDQQRGEIVKWQTRYKNLGDELEQISILTGLGWHIYPDFNSRKWVFDTYNGRNFSVNQNINPPVIFSPEFDNIKSQEYIDSLTSYGNYAIVAGQGEGADREVIMLGSDATGLDRHVVFVDARDVQDVDDLPGRGEAKLAEHQRVISFQAEIINPVQINLDVYTTTYFLSESMMTQEHKGPFEYQQDWDVGDVVTVQNKDWGVTMDSRITEITEIYEGSGFRLDAVFGNSVPTLVDVAKREISQISVEVRR